MPWTGCREHGARGHATTEWQSVTNEIQDGRIGGKPSCELPDYWTPEQVRRILAAMPAGQPWLFALLTG